MISLRRIALVLALSIGCCALSACADLPKTQSEQTEYNAANDPLESVNRVTFDVNDFLDRLLLRPIADLYRNIIPPGIRDRVANIVSNMREPVIFANNLLQGEFSKAGTTAERFLINTTIGIGGSFEVADEWKLYQQTGDFGQTLHSWGVGAGPYIVLPLFGPSTVRDAVGFGVDSVISPWYYIAKSGSHATRDTFQIASFGASGLVRREQNIEGLDALRKGSLDFYAQMRSVYRQYRAKQLGGQDTGSMPNFDDTL